jgi:hypothetical protein
MAILDGTTLYVGNTCLHHDIEITANSLIVYIRARHTRVCKQLRELCLGHLLTCVHTRVGVLTGKRQSLSKWHDHSSNCFPNAKSCQLTRGELQRCCRHHGS